MYKGIDTDVPWAIFKSKLPFIDAYSNEYSVSSATSVGSIKTNLMNAIDEHFEAKRHVSEWCQLTTPFLKPYIKLFTAHSASKAETQNRLLQKVLSDGVAKIKLAQSKLEIISKNFNLIVFTLPTLFQQFEIDFNENSKFFNTKLPYKRFGSNKKAIAILKDRLATVLNFYINLNGSLSQASHYITQTKAKLKIQIEHFEKLNNQSQKLENFKSIADDPQLIEDIVKATQNLIDKCSA